MARISTAEYPDFVSNANILWRKGFERIPLVAKSLYDVIENKLSTTTHSSLDGFTFARRKEEGDTYFQENPTQNYSKTLTKYRIGLQDSVTWEMRTYDRYREINRVLMSLGESAARRLELDLTMRFTFATAASYTDQDGVSITTTVGDTLALGSTAHTVRGSSTTFRNIIANNPVLSKGGLEAAEALFAQQMINSSGVIVTPHPDTLVVANDPATINTARELMQSSADITTNNSAIVNVYKGKYQILVLDYLAKSALGARDSTKEKRWFLVDKAHTDAVLEISEQPHLVSPQPGSNSEAFETDDWLFKCSAAYGLEVTDPKWLVVSLGDGTA